MLQLTAFTAIALFTTGVVGAVIPPLLRRQGVTLTNAGVAVLALVICGASFGVSSTLLPGKSDMAVEIEQIRARQALPQIDDIHTCDRLVDHLAKEATRLRNESRDRARRARYSR